MSIVLVSLSSNEVPDWFRGKRQDLMGLKVERLRVTGNLVARQASHGHMVRPREGPYMKGWGVTIWA